MITNNPSSSGYGDNISARKQEIRALADASASERQNWLKRSAFFHNEDLLYLKFLIPEGARVLELGCGTGELLAALKPSFGVGVHFSAGMIAQAKKAHPHLSFFVGGIEDPAFIRSLTGAVRRHRGGRHSRSTIAKLCSRICTSCVRARRGS